MQENDYFYIELLKQKIVAVMQQSYPGINPSISDWKGQEIINFQEDLRIKVNANISEKWFYTHMKSSFASLPRIDMLNILSKYSGYENWDDFVFKNKPKVSISQSIKNPNRYFIYVPVLAVIIVGLFFLLFKLFDTREYLFTFTDADTHEQIKSDKTEIILLPEGESPVHYLVEKDGIFHLKTDKSKIRMLVKAPYYKVDTIVRIVRKFHKDEMVMLKPNDYELMIHYFSMMKVDDWEKRRNSLNEMFNDGAMIYQVINSKEASGMALYNKQEFIDKLTMPSGSLNNIEVLESQYKEGKIILLRFRINPEKK